MGLKEEKALGESFKFVVRTDAGLIRHPETEECTTSEIKAHDFKTLRRAKLYRSKLEKEGKEVTIEGISWDCLVQGE